MIAVVRYVIARHRVAQQFTELRESNDEVQMKWFCFFRTELLKTFKIKPSDKEKQYHGLLILFVWGFRLWFSSEIVTFSQNISFAFILHFPGENDAVRKQK